jgi:hypothetical protein
MLDKLTLVAEPSPRRFVTLRQDVAENINEPIHDIVSSCFRDKSCARCLSSARIF